MREHDENANDTVALRSWSPVMRDRGNQTHEAPIDHADLDIRKLQRYDADYL